MLFKEQIAGDKRKYLKCLVNGLVGNKTGQNLLLLGEGHGIEELAHCEQTNSREDEGGDIEDPVNRAALQVDWHAIIHLWKETLLGYAWDCLVFH